MSKPSIRPATPGPPLLFNLAVFALPFFAGMTAGLAAYHSGAGVVGSLIVGFTAGAITLLVGQAIFATFGSPVLRGLIALLFAAPAAVAGYHATLALARIGDGAAAQLSPFFSQTFFSQRSSV